MYNYKLKNKIEKKIKIINKIINCKIINKIINYKIINSSLCQIQDINSSIINNFKIPNINSQIDLFIYR